MLALVHIPLQRSFSKISVVWGSLKLSGLHSGEIPRPGVGSSLFFIYIYLVYRVQVHVSSIQSTVAREITRTTQPRPSVLTLMCMYISVDVKSKGPLKPITKYWYLGTQLGPFSCKRISTEKGTRPMKMIGPSYSPLLSRTPIAKNVNGTLRPIFNITHFRKSLRHTAGKYFQLGTSEFGCCPVPTFLHQLHLSKYTGKGICSWITGVSTDVRSAR